MPEDTDNRVWHLIRSKLGEEFLAEKALAGLIEEVFLPVLHPIKNRPRGELASVPVPLFSGHLFARLDPRNSQQTVKYAIGVRGLVMRGKVPVMVPNPIIDLLKQLAQTQGRVQRLELRGEMTGINEFRSELESLFLQPFSADERLMVLFKAIDAAHRAG